ncbi:hypothetical protein RCO27_15845 [Sphingosinicella sp. LHD-64]|nr:hypothetical protein [Sphingosinicella sp. LHD-64]MDQ8757702.1 hypothetical protein [Sphingosinicella sp. LHD-64]
MHRREFLGLAALMPALAAFPGLAEARRPDLSRGQRLSTAGEKTEPPSL